MARETERPTPPEDRAGVPGATPARADAPAPVRLRDLRAAASLAPLGPYEILPEFADPVFLDDPASETAPPASPRSGPSVQPRLRRPRS